MSPTELSAREEDLAKSVVHPGSQPPVMQALRELWAWTVDRSGYNKAIREKWLHLERLILDLAPVSEAAAEQRQQEHASFLDMKSEQDKIAQFLTANYGREIARGEHAAQSLSAVVIRYLSRERNRISVQLRRRIGL